ncbi:hypothetical protein ANCCAN_19646 [Ancylostoma caninum]|uniref:Phlebovirus glycoprotein G2 fusion domain-containing protein n=1 Tax=Ancylostoma caninum TaxID=29170 RepID=A0A368FW54_ANCCA|nr:hypothetical protein ANCCAN_19646 [Ancylostoma caninum]
MMVAKPSKPLFGKIQTAIMLLAIASSAVTASPTGGAVKCLKGFVEIIPPKSNFELCFDNHCRSFQNVSESLHYKLEHSPHPDKTRTRLKVATQNQTSTADKLCDPPDFCDNMGYFLSKSLAGNPHCWPTGAITSAVIIAYTLLLVLLAILTLMMKKFSVGGKLGSSVRNATNLSNFEVMALNRRLTPIAVLALTLLVNVSIACQHGYLRHTVDLTCESKGVCRYAYNREVLFNRVHKELCILIRHNNRTVGTVKISRKPLLLSCSKVSLFFTRDTTPRVYQKTRCPQAGSCVDNKCATIAPDEIVPELEASAKYPGYSTCTRSCSGLVCGCFLPLPACAFFRLAHVPRSENVFEVVRCQDWKVAVPIDVEVTMYNTEKNYSALLTPYISKKIGDFNMNVISVQDPHSQLLNSRYAISDTEAFVVPDQYRLPVKCETHEMAFSHFRNCTNDMVCACEGAKTHSTCNCPSDSIQTIRLDPSNRLPVTTPSLEIAMVSESLIASSDVGEFTLTVESEMLIDSTEVVIDQPCMVEIHNIRRCYDCMAGARVNISCFSPSHTWLTIDCDSQAFAVECDANDKQSEIVLEFSSAVVQQKCTTVCNRKSVNIELSATLVYHPSVGKRSVFEIQDPPFASIVTDWFADLSFPDLTPLIVTMRKH